MPRDCTGEGLPGGDEQSGCAAGSHNRMEDAAQATFAVQRKGYRQVYQPSSFETYKAYKAQRAQFDQHLIQSRKGPNFDSVASAGLGLLGTAASAAPVLAPVALAAGIGYGTYKLGQSFNLW